MFGVIAADSRKQNAASSNSLTSTSLVCSELTTVCSNLNVPGATFRSVLGWVPVEIAPPSVGSVLFLNRYPHKAIAQTIDDPNLLILPEGATIVGAVTTNNNEDLVPNTVTVALSAQAWQAPSLGTVPTVTTNFLLPATVGSLLNVPGGLTIGRPGPAYHDNATPTNVSLGVNYTVLGAGFGVALRFGGLLTEGSLAVLIHYVV